MFMARVEAMLLLLTFMFNAPSWVFSAGAAGARLAAAVAAGTLAEGTTTKLCFGSTGILVGHLGLAITDGGLRCRNVALAGNIVFLWLLFMLLSGLRVGAWGVAGVG